MCGELLEIIGPESPSYRIGPSTVALAEEPSELPRVVAKMVIPTLIDIGLLRLSVSISLTSQRLPTCPFNVVVGGETNGELECSVALTTVGHCGSWWQPKGFLSLPILLCCLNVWLNSLSHSYHELLEVECSPGATEGTSKRNKK